jgi:hypothetical protein
MQPFPQLFAAVGGSGTYLDSSNSPKSHFDRLIEDGSDVSPLDLVFKHCSATFWLANVAARWPRGRFHCHCSILFSNKFLLQSYTVNS